MLCIDRFDHFIRVRAEGVLTAADYTFFEQRFEDELGRGNIPVPLLLDLSPFRGWTVGALLQDLRFDLRHRRTFSRIAVLGDRTWHKWISCAARPVFSGPLRYFTAQEEARATAWLRNGAP